MKKHKGLRRLALILWVAACMLAMFVYRLVQWVFMNWGNLRMDELMYTMTASLSGTNPAMIKSAVAHVVPLTLATGAAAAVLWLILRGRRLWRPVRWVALVAAVATIGLTAKYFGDRIGFGEYVENQSIESSFIDDNYVDPARVGLAFPEKKQNLVYIFIESMEISFADAANGGAKARNVIPELSEIARENETFAGAGGLPNGGYALQGSTYTMGGLFAQTSGLPLNVSNETLTMAEGFLPGITTLGDILGDAGYKNVFCIGTDAAFAGRDRYFETHGDYEILDYNYSVENGEVDPEYSRPWWGYDDYMLYENAKQHLLALAAEDRPFNFTLLTVDTHAENGYICKLCGDEFGDDQYSNALACASRQAADFIAWIQRQDFYENTTIVVNGDHCTMDSDYADDLPADYVRRTYTAYINPRTEARSDRRRVYSTMDNFPTTLAALGVEIEGDMLGLGVNLFSDRETLLEQYDIDALNTSLGQKTDFFSNRLGARIARTVDIAFDAEASQLVVTLPGGVNYDGSFGKVYCNLSYNGGAFSLANSNYVRLKEADGVYTARVAADKYYYGAGAYKAAVYLALPDGLPMWYCEGSVELEAMDLTGPIEIIRDNAQAIMRLTYRAPEDFGNKKVWFPVWSAENGQDDKVVYEAESDGEGKWHCTVNLEDHATKGGLTVEVYSGKKKPTDKRLSYTLTLK